MDIIGYSVYALDIENLNVRADAVPGPASLALLGVGLIALGASRKKRAV